jgi:hypothetical protein
MLRGLCHHGMELLRVAHGGDGLHVWRVAANTLNKQWRTADKGVSPVWGLGKGLTTHRKKTTCYEMSHRASDRKIILEWILGK